MTDKPVCEVQKNSREAIRFRLGELKGQKFVDMRIYVTGAGEDCASGHDPAPTPKGLAVSPQLWPQFRAALDQVEAFMIKQGWLDRGDLEPRVEKWELPHF